MRSLIVLLIALGIALAAVSYSHAAVQAQAYPEVAVAAPQVVAQVACPDVVVQAVPQQVVVQQAAPTAYQIVTKEKRPGLRNRIRAFRSVPKRRVQRLQAVPVSTQCVGVSIE